MLDFAACFPAIFVDQSGRWVLDLVFLEQYLTHSSTRRLHQDKVPTNTFLLRNVQSRRNLISGPVKQESTPLSHSHTSTANADEPIVLAKWVIVFAARPFTFSVGSITCYLQMATGRQPNSSFYKLGMLFSLSSRSRDTMAEVFPKLTKQHGIKRRLMERNLHLLSMMPCLLNAV